MKCFRNGIYYEASVMRKTLRISGVMVFGPNDEKAAMNGAGFVGN